MYYYKDEKGNKYCYKKEHEGLISITEREFNQMGRSVPDPELLKQLWSWKNALAELLAWFDTYDKQVLEFQRCQRLGVEYDCKYGDIEQLDRLAVQKASEINTLREQISLLESSLRD